MRARIGCAFRFGEVRITGGVSAVMRQAVVKDVKAFHGQILDTRLQTSCIADKYAGHFL